MLLVPALQSTHRVHYDDGDIHDEDLLHGDYRLLDGQESQARLHS